jgi:hypothetical protein
LSRESFRLKRILKRIATITGERTANKRVMRTASGEKPDSVVLISKEVNEYETKIAEIKIIITKR